jgi:uncharacterized protein
MLKYRISDFCHFVDVGSGYRAAYNSLTLGVVFMENKIAELFEKATGKIIQIPPDVPNELSEVMQERKLIFPLGERDDLKDYLRMQNLLRDNGIAILYLLATDGCNLGCTYCYIESALPADYKFSMMSRETADKALDLFVENISKTVDEPKVVIYGGEPLVNMDIVRYVIDRFQYIKAEGKIPKKTGLIINTNATLIDEDFLKFISGKEVQIAVSLDGDRKMHDEMRKYKDGTGSYDKVIENCKRMRDNGINFGFSVTVTKANIHRLEDVLVMIHEKFGMNSVGFNIAINQSENVIGMSEAEYAELVTEKLISCFKICRDKGIYEDRIMRKVNAFVSGYPYIYDCGAPGDQLVVSPDGMVGVCQAYCGNKKNFVSMNEIVKPADHPIWSEWRFRSPLYQDQCYSCIALSICGGGCPYNAELKSGSIWGIDEAFCVHSRGTVEFLIKDLYEQTIHK